MIKLFIITSSADGQPGSTFRRLLKSAPFGLALVIFFELCVVPYVVPFVAPFFEAGGNSWTILGIDLSGSMHVVSSSNSEGYTFVDVDNDTFSEWRVSGHTDRSKIKALIEQIAANTPKAIVVDIDLYDLRIDNVQDNELINYVLNYQSDNLPLIFVQSLRRRPNSSEQDPLQIVSLPLMEAKSDGPIYFASAGFLRSDDGKVRSWLLGEPACDDQGDRLRTIPSVELLLLPIEGKLNPGLVNQTVRTAYVGNCSSVRTIMHEIRLGKDRVIRLSPRHLPDKIVYTMKTPPEWDEKQFPTGHVLQLKAKSIVTDGNPLKKTDRKNLFLKRIVVIGGSNDESRDTYNTPYGPMPGAMVLINAMESLRVYPQLREFSEALEKLIGVLIGFLVWIGLEALRIEMGPVIMCLFGYVPALIFSAMFLYGGVWFSVSGVVAGALAHFIWKLIWNLVNDIRKDPHNWFRSLLAKEF